jgi:hypothetical protein
MPIWFPLRLGRAAKPHQYYSVKMMLHPSGMVETLSRRRKPLLAKVSGTTQYDALESE